MAVMTTLMLGLPARAADTSSSMSSVTVTIAPALEVVEWPDPLVALSQGLAPGDFAVTGPLSFHLKANSPWVLQIKSSSGGGQLSEFDTSSATYVSSGSKMSIPVQWSLSESGPWAPIQATEADITSGGSTGSAGQHIQLYLKTEATFDDVPLTAPNSEYRLDVGYTASLLY